MRSTAQRSPSGHQRGNVGTKATARTSFEITDRGMQARPDAAADIWYRHSFGRGAGVFEGRITPAGGRAFYFRYTGPDGSRVRLTLGPYSPKGEAGLTLSDARRKAAEWSAVYLSGERDLSGHLERAEEAKRAEAERVQRDAAATAQRLTVRGLFDLWRSTELLPHERTDGGRRGRKDGGEYVFQQFTRHVFPHVGALPVQEVRKGQLLAILDRVRADGRLRTANVLLASLKQMFRFALAREHVDRNPLDTVTKRDAGGPETERQRILAADEVRALARQVEGARLRDRSAAALWIILGTATRISEAMGARWEHVDLDRRRWYLPSTKNGRDHDLHLSDFVCEHFRALREHAQPSDPWVFPNVAGDGPVCVKSFGKQLADRQRAPDRRMKGRSQLTTSLMLPGGKWTAHDLRRTAATMMAEMGVGGDVIDECLNHVIESRVRRIYIRDRRLQEQARAFDLLGDRLARLARGDA